MIKFKSAILHTTLPTIALLMGLGLNSVHAMDPPPLLEEDNSELSSSQTSASKKINFESTEIRRDREESILTKLSESLSILYEEMNSVEQKRKTAKASQWQLLEKHEAESQANIQGFEDLKKNAELLLEECKRATILQCEGLKREHVDEVRGLQNSDQEAMEMQLDLILRLYQSEKMLSIGTYITEINANLITLYKDKEKTINRLNDALDAQESEALMGLQSIINKMFVDLKGDSERGRMQKEFGALYELVKITPLKTNLVAQSDVSFNEDSIAQYVANTHNYFFMLENDIDLIFSAHQKRRETKPGNTGDSLSAQWKQIETDYKEHFVDMYYARKRMSAIHQARMFKLQSLISTDPDGLWLSVDKYANLPSV